MKKRGDEIEGSKAPPLLGRRKASKVRESFPFFLSSLSSIPLLSFVLALVLLDLSLGLIAHSVLSRPPEA